MQGKKKKKKLLLELKHSEILLVSKLMRNLISMPIKMIYVQYTALNNIYAESYHGN